jgi:hypothetical protein
MFCKIVFYFPCIMPMLSSMLMASAWALLLVHITHLLLGLYELCIIYISLLHFLFLLCKKDSSTLEIHSITESWFFSKVLSWIRCANQYILCYDDG